LAQIPYCITSSTFLDVPLCPGETESEEEPDSGEEEAGEDEEKMEDRRRLSETRKQP
jgi:hypothetical protein